jgi:uncharacterized protein
LTKSLSASRQSVVDSFKTDVNADPAAPRFFNAVIASPRMVVIVMIIALAAAFVPLTALQVDTSADAFLDADNPALLYRDVIKEQFGLSDPYFIAVLDRRGQGIYNPATLNLLVRLSSSVEALDNIDSYRVVSLASADNIVGSEEGFTVQPFIEDLPVTPASAAAIRHEVADFPLYRDSIVGPSAEATVIVAELIDEAASEETYHGLLDIIASLNLPEGVEVHVAGEGAIAGYLGAYIDADARKLIPLAITIVLLIVAVAFRRFVPALLALVVVLASIVIALGLMSLSGIPFYVITNTLPVILVGISVADTIHIVGHFYQLQAQSPKARRDQLVARTLGDMWRPVTATSLTTAAGFLGLYFASEMPPFKYFGLFAAVGVMVAWLYSLVFLPAAMVLVGLRVHPSFVGIAGERRHDATAAFMLGIGRLTLGRPLAIAGSFALLGVAGAYCASQLVVDGDRVQLFDEQEPIYIADGVINRHLYGTNTLDIVVETAEPGGLLEPANLRRIEALQAHLQTLPHVTGSTSIVDYLKQMNRALNGGGESTYVLPEASDLAAQYFLLYSMTSDPSDFEEEVDYDYQLANVRVTMNIGRYRDFGPVVESLEVYLDEVFNTEDMQATLSGRVSLNYHWLKNVADSHFTGLAIAIALVYLVAALIYRSLVAGLFALIPVCSSVLCVYAFMVLAGLNLEIGTSMFAAVSIGLGVDFAIHTLDRMRGLAAETKGDFSQMFEKFYSSTGRALLFNALAMACGFGVLVFSKVSQLSDFGSVVVLSMLVSFIASMTLAPALLVLIKPGFLGSDVKG